MPVDFTALATDFASGPLASACAPLIAAGYDQAVADLYNATTGPGAGNVTLASMPRDDFLLAILPAVGALANADAPTQAAWDRYLACVRAADNIAVSNPAIQAMLAAAVAANLLTQDQASAVNVRVGSRAEVLFGAGTVLTASDVCNAR